MCKYASKLLSYFWLLLIFIPAGAQPVPAGVAEIQLALKKLNVLGSALMIAAHPDDENTALLAYLARGRLVRTAYLSATRGEGGQNLIGAERGALLGVLRTQELLAARRIDGAEQFFTRAIDFGFSKSAQEALFKWGRDRVLSDMVWIIRQFRPDVVILRFSGTPRDGHGQHQASAILGKEAFFAAADPQRFPEQLSKVRPWKARRLFFNVFSFGRGPQRGAAIAPESLEVDVGEYNPLLGRSFAELAGASRSMHRSQGMGSAERRGSVKNYLTLLAGDPVRNDIFEGIDTGWSRVPGGEQAGHALQAALKSFELEHPENTVPKLLQARAAIAALKDEWARIKLRELDEAAALCTGLWLGAEADRASAVPGSDVEVRWTAINRSPLPVTLSSVELHGMGVKKSASVQKLPLHWNQPVSGKIQRTIPASQPYSQPFWLRRPPQGEAYQVEDQELIGLAEDPPVLSVCFRLESGGSGFEVMRPVVYRYVDDVRGELTQPFRLVPPVAVRLSEDVVLFPSADSRKLHVEVTSHIPAQAGSVRVEAGDNWKVRRDSAAFRLETRGEKQVLEFELDPPTGEKVGVARAMARLNGGLVDTGMILIDYPHIPSQAIFPKAETRLVHYPVKITARRIGYVMGAGDEMPQAIRQLGTQVVLLTAADLEQGDLSGFDAIVTGVRAYNVRPDLRASQSRLLQYVREGGTLIVQYNVAGDLPPLGPYPFTVSRARVAEEDAPVRFSTADSNLLKEPNLISASDFEGWVQERGLYFASSWDPRYQTILECHDEGEKPQAGGLLYTRYGRGVYIFTAYSWFRQLPAGVPGAYRIFANMLSARQR